jgi:hypothetical protein
MVVSGHVPSPRRPLVIGFVRSWPIKENTIGYTVLVIDESQELQMGLSDCSQLICIGAVLLLDRYARTGA